MAFRRQDIRKTTRKSDDGGPRRLYPRYLRDRAIEPLIDRALDVLDAMVGQRRADLAPDVLLDLFGDPKLARCLLVCLADTYRYRTLTFPEAVGAGPASQLAAAAVATPADAREIVYTAANDRLAGFAAPPARATLLAAVAANLGVEHDTLESVLYLDAERNAVLTRIATRPTPRDVVVRYNALLTFSVLRHASRVSLPLPGFDADALAAIGDSTGVPIRHEDGSAIFTPVATRDGGSAWAGARLARAVTQALILAPHAPIGEALVDLNSHRTRLVLDAKTVATLRLRERRAANADETAFIEQVLKKFSESRRPGTPGEGWSIRRLPDPIAADETMLLPDAALTRDDRTIPLVVAATASDRDVIERISRLRPVIALGMTDDLDGAVAALHDDLGALAPARARDAHWVEQLRARGWLPVDQVPPALAGRISDDGLARLNAVAISGFGLCRHEMLDELRVQFLGRAVDVAALRADLAGRFGEGSGTDALALYLLSTWPAPLELAPREAA